jgi:DNA-binding MarR family transcriptional regulator
MATAETVGPARDGHGELPEIDRDFRDLADFRYAIRLFLRFSEDQARAAGITPQQHMLLLVVRGHASYPDVTIGDVAERMQVRHHSASRLVERGVQRGLLERRVDSVDRRKALVSLTAEGLRMLRDITEANKRELRSLEDALFRDSLLAALHAYNSSQQV